MRTQVRLETVAGNGELQSAMSGSTQVSGATGAGILSIALIGPDEYRRKEVAAALSGFPGVLVREFTSYPPDLDDLPQMLQQHHNIVLVDLDSDPEYALNVVESLCSESAATVMVYSATADRTLVVRAMRAGAREFFALPLAATEVADALARGQPPAAAAALMNAARRLTEPHAMGRLFKALALCHPALPELPGFAE